MHLYQGVIIFILVVIVLKTRQNSEVYSIVWLHAVSISMYYCISEEFYNYYYTVMCFVLLVVGMLLRTRFKVAAICSYVLVPLTALGYVLWYKHYPHDLYDVISAIILIIQFLSTLPKALSNGMGTTINRYSVVGSGCFDGNKECDTMYKTSQTQEDQR